MFHDLNELGRFLHDHPKFTLGIVDVDLVVELLLLLLGKHLANRKEREVALRYLTSSEEL